MSLFYLKVLFYIVSVDDFVDFNVILPRSNEKEANENWL